MTKKNTKPKKLPELKSIKNKGKKTKAKSKPINPKNIPSLQLKSEHDIAMDFAIKVYERFDKVVKSIVLFGSTAKQTTVAGSDIDIVIIIDDIAIKWDQELIAWYREELEKTIKAHPYKQSLHINTIKLSTWWEDLMRGDPVIINVLRYGESLIDKGGFFEPLKFLLLQGKIRPSPEAIYVSLQRAPMNLQRSKAAQLNSIEGLFWAMVDASHAALIAINVLPPSPEHIFSDLKENFVEKNKLKMKYVEWYRDLLFLHKQIGHGERRNLKGVEIDQWMDRTQEFIDVMAMLVRDIVSSKS